MINLKKRIRLGFCLIGATAVALTAILLSYTYYYFYIASIGKELKNEAILLKNLYSDNASIGDDSFFNKLGLDSDLRITLVTAKGTVTFDSTSQDALKVNHLDRPEIAAAFKTGSGYSTRRSATIGVKTYYYAILNDDGSVIRVAKDVHSVWSMFPNMFLFVLVDVAFIILLCLIFASFFTKKILSPIKAMASSMDNISPSNVYEELVPFVEKIGLQNTNINKQIRRLETEKNKIQLITDNMSEGLVLLSPDTTILTVNHSAVDLLEALPGEYLGKHISELSRNSELLTGVNEALLGKGKSAVVEIGGKRIQLLSNPVYSGDTLTGAICIIMDITDRITAEKSRQDFTANVSHELKTPLTSISGYAEMIENGIAAEQDIKRFASKIHKEASRLVLVINDIIRLSQLDGQFPRDSFELVDLKDVVEQTVYSLELIAEQKEISVNLQITSCKLMANRRMMEELVYNLCDNSIRYNKVGGNIDIILKLENNTIVLKVSDSGIGIPSQHHQRIFERFYRVDKSRSKASGGTGLGLAIVKHIVEQHMGQIFLQSEENKGTVITVVLPAN